MRKNAEMDSYLGKAGRVSPGWNAVLLIIMLIFAVIVLVPVILVVIVSFSSAQSIATVGYSFTPTQWTNVAYDLLLGKGLGTQIYKSYRVTILNALVGTVLSLFVMSLYAYVLSRKAFAFRKLYTFLLFFTMLFSGGLVPSYIINSRVLGLYNTFWVLIFPSLVGAYNVIILRTFIQTSIPESLVESAKIDGANDFTIYFRIVLPLFKAGLATIGLFCVVGRWNDWFTGFLYIENPDLVPLQTLLYKIQSNMKFIKDNSSMMGSVANQELLKSIPGESTQMAVVVITAVPIIFAYPFFQRFFIKGMTIGSIKG